MKIKFTKMQGIGNDYVYIDCFRQKLRDPAKLAPIVSDRHFGIGSDGLILVCPGEKGDVRMEMYNRDGSLAGMCGNGARCVAKFAYDAAYVQKEHFLLETGAGLKEVWIREKNPDGSAKMIEIDMGIPKAAKNFPEEIEVLGKREFFMEVDMGNPHAVYRVESEEELQALDLKRIGPAYENHPRFPLKVNSEFIYIRDRENILMRVWERGSGETLACGNGACASAYAAILLKEAEHKLCVHLPGGALQIRYEADSAHLFMCGEAKTVFRGEIDLED